MIPRVHIMYKAHIRQIHSSLPRQTARHLVFGQRDHVRDALNSRGAWAQNHENTNLPKYYKFDYIRVELLHCAPVLAVESKQRDIIIIFLTCIPHTQTHTSAAPACTKRIHILQESYIYLGARCA